LRCLRARRTSLCRPHVARQMDEIRLANRMMPRFHDEAANP
jgi:hypothetical protein